MSPWVIDRCEIWPLQCCRHVLGDAWNMARVLCDQSYSGRLQHTLGSGNYFPVGAHVLPLWGIERRYTELALHMVSCPSQARSGVSPVPKVCHRRCWWPPELGTRHLRLITAQWWSRLPNSPCSEHFPPATQNVSTASSTNTLSLFSVWHRF